MLPFRLALLRPHQPVETCVFPGDNDAITVHLGAFLLNEIKGIVSLYRKDLASHEAGNGYRFARWPLRKYCVDRAMVMRC